MYAKTKPMLYLTYTDTKKGQLDTLLAFVWRYLKVNENFMLQAEVSWFICTGYTFSIVIGQIILTNTYKIAKVILNYKLYPLEEL